MVSLKSEAEAVPTWMPTRGHFHPPNSEEKRRREERPPDSTVYVWRDSEWGNESECTMDHRHNGSPPLRGSRGDSIIFRKSKVPMVPTNSLTITIIPLLRESQTPRNFFWNIRLMSTQKYIICDRILFCVRFRLVHKTNYLHYFQIFCLNCDLSDCI